VHASFAKNRADRNSPDSPRINTQIRLTPTQAAEAELHSARNGDSQCSSLPLAGRAVNGKGQEESEARPPPGALFRLPSRSPYRLVLWFPVKRIPSLDGLRAISIAMVVVGHLAKSGHGPRIFWTTYAGIGVSIFFVISGYLITTILLKEHSRTSNIRLRDFYIRRAYRIFPAAFVFMLVVFAFYWRSLRWYDMAAAMLYVATSTSTGPGFLAICGRSASKSSSTWCGRAS
jgi:hypothetical protein